MEESLHSPPSVISSGGEENEIEHKSVLAQSDDKLEDMAYSKQRSGKHEEVEGEGEGGQARLSLRRHSEQIGPRNSVIPRVNCPEKIIICLDVSSDMELGTFRYVDGKLFSPLQMVKKALESFLLTKHMIDNRHQFALILFQDSALWIKDFTSEPQDILTTLEDVQDTRTCDSMQMSSLFDVIAENVSIPEVIHPEVIPPPYVVRAVFVYGRSHQVPEFSFNLESQHRLLMSEYFFLDLFYIHDPPRDDNKCRMIFDLLCDLDTRGTSYIFEVSRNTTHVYDNMAKLMAHPLQRPLQKDASYKLVAINERLN